MKIKKLLRLFALILAISTMLTVKAFATATLQWPKYSEYLDMPFYTYVKTGSGSGGRMIYIMPKPQGGNGNLGTVNVGDRVQILAQHGDYLFFETEDGRHGWNGSKYFTVVALPNESSYFDEPFIMQVNRKAKSGSIYIMPQPETGHGNLGTIPNGTIVIVYAQQGSYYFFEAPDGSLGWNGKSYFDKLSVSSTYTDSFNSESGTQYGYDKDENINEIAYDENEKPNGYYLKWPDEYDTSKIEVLGYEAKIQNVNFSAYLKSHKENGYGHVGKANLGSTVWVCLRYGGKDGPVFVKQYVRYGMYQYGWVSGNLVSGPIN